MLYLNGRTGGRSKVEGRRAIISGQDDKIFFMKKNVCFLFAVLLFSGTWAQTKVISNVSIVDVVKGEVVPGQTVVIEGEQIARIGESGKVKVADGAEIIDATGKYLMPGLVDAHIHFFQSGSIYTRPDALDFTNKFSYEDELDFTWGSVPDYFRRYLRLGITTIMDVGGPFQNFAIRDEVAKEQLSPNVLVTGPLFSSYQPAALTTDDPPIIKVSNKEEAEMLFEKMLPYKPDFIKVWYIVSPSIPAAETFPIVEHINQLAEDNGLKLAVHATQLETAKLAVKAGADILVHSVNDRPIDDEFIQALKKNNVTYIPTLIVSKNYGRAFISEPDKHPQDVRWANPFAFGTLFDLSAMSGEELPARVKRMKNNVASWRATTAQSDAIMAENLSRLTQAGVNIVTGTDAGNIGTMHASSYIQELEAMHKAGLSNAEILKASTVNAASGFGKEKEFGTVSEGKLADLVLLNSNPLENLQHLNDMALVFKSGQMLEPSKLIEESPEMLVQRQLNAYNSRDLEAFLATYAENTQIYDLSGQLLMDGKEAMRSRYKSLFENNPELYCEIKNRITLGNKVIDQEYVRTANGYIDAVAIYEVKDGLIQKVTFVRKD
jgi:imidazolonepropionase-like amidohydrolase